MHTNIQKYVFDKKKKLSLLLHKMFETTALPTTILCNSMGWI
jgi:hypothetical protein